MYLSNFKSVHQGLIVKLAVKKKNVFILHICVVYHAVFY